MINFEEIKKSVLVSIWFMFLTFPIMVIKVDPIEKIILWRWENMAYVGIAIFFLSFVWREFLRRKELGSKRIKEGKDEEASFIQEFLSDTKKAYPILGVLFAAAVIFPFLFPYYGVTVMTTALIWVVLGLGLNIVVGLAGLLDLGYVAFYLVGAYTYALLEHHFGIGFWTILPFSMVIAGCCGILLGYPVLKMRGDYLAIVTLGFGEIIRLIMENWNEFSFGPSGISQIPRPGFFVDLTLTQNLKYMYFIMLGATIFTVFIVNRLQDSRIGRAWIALREDETACQAMGIDVSKTKLTAFAMGASWAGMVGVMFAAKTTFINPASFTFWESAMILSVVVLGGRGSVFGVILGALILSLSPEFLRAFSEYRMLVFGGSMVLMMVFRPQGLITNVRRIYKYKKE